jgi:hypothetical protein
MLRALLLIACVVLAACGRTVDPASLRTERLFANSELVEIALGPGAASGDADHATVASAGNGDVLVAFQVKQAKADSAEVHAVYFRYLGPELNAWEPSPTLVLAQKDEFGRGCGKPDVIDCSTLETDGKACFAVVWARRNADDHLGCLEAALLAAPSEAGGAARRIHSDGLAGFVLDAELDTEIATVTPDLVRAAAWQEGQFGVVYTHRKSDQGDAAAIRLRWREAYLSVDGATAEVLVASDLVDEIPVLGTLYQYPGGVVIPDAVIAESQAILLVAHGESSADRDGSYLVLTQFELATGTAPVALGRLVIEPDLTRNEQYLRRPQLNSLGPDGLLLVADAFAARPSKERRTRVFQLELNPLRPYDWPWSGDIDGQESPIAVGDGVGHVGVFFHRQGVLGYGGGNFMTRRDAELAPLQLGSNELGEGRQPHLSLLLDPAGERGGNVLFMTTFARSEREDGSPRRISIRAFAGGLSKL